jgi:hypothetical protein
MALTFVPLTDGASQLFRCRVEQAIPFTEGCFFAIDAAGHLAVHDGSGIAVGVTLPADQLMLLAAHAMAAALRMGASVEDGMKAGLISRPAEGNA